MLNQTDQVDAIFLVARHGRAAPIVAGHRVASAARNGDVDEARRWRMIRRHIDRHVA